MKHFLFIILFTLSWQANAQTLIKKSNSGICHAPSSPYYEKTKNFRPFDNIEACIQSGGRLPKSSSSSYSDKQRQSPDAITYSRNAFRHWSDFDNDCQNERQETLIRLSTAQVTLSADGCTVIKGRWNDPYTGKTFFSARDLHIDHLVPLKAAWVMGASAWSDSKREKFANDPINLLAVDGPTNMSKGAKTITQWLPPNEKFHCQYATRYLRVLISYGFPEKYKTEARQVKDKVC